ncbi:MAG: glycosyltransferase [Chloroflexi bacterium]|nr:glycosyltransferase [Chloroflexota bacterium]MBI5712238.1 glycosyltransferase [Chloroflexota bacterium]
MKIVLMHYSAPPVVGGVESVLAHHARLMTNARHEVQVLVGRGEVWDNHIPVTVLPHIDSRHSDVLAVKAELDRGIVSSKFHALVETIKTNLFTYFTEADIVIAHNICSLHKNLALTAALHQFNNDRHRPCLILWHHDLAWTTPRYRAELHEGYPWDLLRISWQAVRHVVVSEARQHELAKLMNLDKDLIQVVPNGAEIRQLFKLETQTVDLLTQMNLDDAEPFLLLPVRLTPRKNIELALRVLAALRHEFPNAMLVVTGPEGPHNPANADYKEMLLRLRDSLGLQGAAHFLAEYTTEFLPDTVVADFFRLADALLMPSREEGFGIPLIEAAITRLPIFCTDIPSLRALGGSGISLFSPDANPSDVADLITTRLRTDKVYRFAARAKRTYTWERIYTASIAPLLEAASPESAKGA